MRRVLFLGIVTVMLASCMSVPYARHTEMVAMSASELDAESQLLRAITINSVLGGEETYPSPFFNVENEAIREALRQSLAAHAMLAVGPGRYHLDAELLDVELPFSLDVLNVTVPTTVKYTLTVIEENRILFQETVSVSPTTPFGEAVIGRRRTRIAIERSIRENFAQFFELLIQSFGTPAEPSNAS